MLTTCTSILLHYTGIQIKTVLPHKWKKKEKRHIQAVAVQPTCKPQSDAPNLPSTTVHAYTHAPPSNRCHWPPLGGPPLSHRPYQHSWAREKAGAEEETPCFPGRRRPGPVARSPPARPTKFGPPGPGPGPGIWDLEGEPGDAGCEPFRLRTPLVLDGSIQVTAERGGSLLRMRSRFTAAAAAAAAARVARAHVARVARAQAATAPVSHRNMGNLRRCAVTRFFFTTAQTQQHVPCSLRL